MDGIPDDLKSFLINNFDQMSGPRYDKCTTMYHLAKEALREGVIVEMGTYHGNGTISLCWGARDGNGAKVHTIDHFEIFSGWIGEEYSPKDLDIFTANIIRAGVHPYMHVSKFKDAATAWREPISLLVWDGGYRKPKADIVLFAKFLIKGGILAVRETYGQITFDALEICNEYASDGSFSTPDWKAGGFYVSRKVR